MVDCLIKPLIYYSNRKENILEVGRMKVVLNHVVQEDLKTIIKVLFIQSS